MNKIRVLPMNKGIFNKILPDNSNVLLDFMPDFNCSEARFLTDEDTDEQEVENEQNCG